MDTKHNKPNGANGDNNFYTIIINWIPLTLMHWYNEK